MPILRNALVLLAVAASLPVAVAEELSPGMQYAFRGSLIPGEEVENPVASFELSIFVEPSTAGEVRWSWLLEESGAGGWDWPERFGRMSAKANGEGMQGLAPALLVDRGDKGKSVMGIAVPFLFQVQELVPGSNWEIERDTFSVTELSEFQDRQVAKIDVTNPLGFHRRFWRDLALPLVVQQEQQVFMGMGEEHSLVMELTASEQLDDAQAAKVSQAFDALAKLRQDLNLPERTQAVTWNAEQLTLLGERTPELQQILAGTPLAKLGRVMEKDVQAQVARVGALAAQAANSVGDKRPEFSLKTLGGQSVTHENLQGVTVLHFWDYRDEPLVEPYGQVGYLDFLHNLYKGQEIHIYGVAVDGRFADMEQKREAMRGVRKLVEFMNLSYPVLLDSGELLAEFGDPRQAGGTLPLFVVISSDGTIVHQHPGFYNVERDRGLKELERAVLDAAGK